MYIPKNMEMSDSDAIAALISDYGFGLLISPDMDTTRLPLIYQRNDGEPDCIIGHMARANPQWKNLAGTRVSVVFSGPHSYISPQWYVTQPAVPTWNYASVQCFGTFVELDPPATLAAINTLINKYEPAISESEGLMPSDYLDKLLTAVVGFKIIIDSIHAKEKLGQHKTVEDQLGVFEALSKSKIPDSNELARYMSKRKIGIGG